jgi:CRISPR system Cascade subunit CasE
MFLTKLVLNLRSSMARRDLARPYEMHRTLMNSYPHQRTENRCDLLYRVDPSRNGPPVVLVQTRADPDWTRLPPGYLLGKAESKLFELVVTTGQHLRFRLRANPTKKAGTSSKTDRLAGRKNNGHRVALLRDDEQLRWLLGKASASGFRIPGKWDNATHPQTGELIQLPNFRVDVVPEGRDRNDKPGHGGEFVAVRFDGLLEVTDPATFWQTVEDGLGSAKAFGFGLLSVAPCNGGS